MCTKNRLLELAYSSPDDEIAIAVTQPSSLPVLCGTVIVVLHHLSPSSKVFYHREQNNALVVDLCIKLPPSLNLNLCFKAHHQ